MQNRLYDRKIEVGVGGQTYSYPALEINFDIPKTTSPNVDIAEINIYNLSDTSVSSIMNNNKIIVNAGYGSDLGVVFDGYVEQVLPEWSGPTKKVTVLASDVGPKVRSREIKKTYENSSTKFIITDLAKILGLKIGNVSPANDVWHEDYSVDGLIYDEIKKLASESKSKMYTTNNTLYVLPFSSASNTGVVLNRATGLVGSPVREEKEEQIGEGDNRKSVKIVEYVITSALNHEIKQDTWIKVESKTLNGKFRVLEVVHNKDFKTVVRVRG